MVLYCCHGLASSYRMGIYPWPTLISGSHRPLPRLLPWFALSHQHPAVMVTNFLRKYQLQNHHLVLPKKQFVTYALYALIALAFLHHLIFYPAPASEKSVVVAQVQDEVAAGVSAARVNAREHLLPPPPPPQQGDEVLRNQRAQGTLK